MRLLLITSLFLFSCSHHKSHHHKAHKKHTGKHSHSGHAHHHRFDNAEKWARVFEKETRKKWQKPNEVIKALNLNSRSVVADIGAGTGYFPVRIAKKVTQGRVWAMDIEPNLIRFLKERKEKEKIKNMFPLLGESNDPLLPEKVDVIMIVDTYHHIGNRAQYFRNLRKYLKKNGRLVIIDFKKEDLPIGPKKAMKLSSKEVIEELKGSGFSLAKSENFLPYQYMLTFN